MPWKEVCTMDERLRFIADIMSDEGSMASLCRDYGISRKTGYKYLSRYWEYGIDGLKDRSRSPCSHPHAVSPEITGKIVKVRSEHPRWGARKLKAYLERHHPNHSWPAASTIGEVLKRHGLVVPRRRSRKSPPYTKPFVSCGGPNQVWCADFKGWFRTQDGQRCDPFTLSDAYSRYLLRCQAVLRPDYQCVKPVFDAAFREYGLPTAIRTDNGVPFATTTLAGLSRLSIEWIKLGIRPERIRPGKPADNGRHERMHRTLKDETATPPHTTVNVQQKAFDLFRHEYNHVRPHESIDQRTPADLYEPSPRPYPARIPEVVYPNDYIIRRVHSQGDLRWRGQQMYFSDTLAGEEIGLHQVDDRYYDIYFAHLKLAVLDDHLERIIRPKRTTIKKRA
jgi:transposase InsO family protein